MAENISPIHRPRPRDGDRGKEIPKKLGEEGLQHEEEDIRQKPVATADLNNIFNKYNILYHIHCIHYYIETLAIKNELSLEATEVAIDAIANIAIIIRD